MSMPFINPDRIAQPEEYLEGDFAGDPPSDVDLDTDVAGVEEAPTLTPEAAETADNLGERLHEDQ